MTITVQDGVFGYLKQERIILNNISFSVNSGDVLAILGPNGSGKTTLLRCMMGLLKWQSGGTYIDGTPLQNIPYNKLWKNISYVPQARQASAAYTVEEMVLLGITSSVGQFSLPSKQDVDMANKAIKRLDIEGIRHRKCSELSGGEFQMVLIARALACNPSAIILDEPESNLDFKNQLLVLDIISQLASEGITCIFNTHYPGHALRRANKALMLSKNGDYRFGDVMEIVTEQSIAEYFGVKAVIGEVETSGNMYRDVIPISVGGSTAELTDLNEQVIAGITIIMNNDNDTEKINRVLHEYSPYIIGRMGMPYRKAGINIINLTLDAPANKVMALTDKLNLFTDINIKTTYSAVSGDKK